MFGVYTPDGRLLGHYPDACAASTAARSLGEGARVTSERGAYVVRGGTLVRATTRRAPSTGWQPLPADYIESTMAAMYGGSLN